MNENISFEATITEQDLYKYNLHHSYTSTQGIFSIVVAALLIVAWVMQFDRLSLVYLVLYPLIALMFLLYIPLNLRLRAKQQMQQEVFKHPLTYTLGDDGISVSSPTAEKPAVLPWDYVYKIVTWSGYLLIYSNRVNAYIIPRTQISGQEQQIFDYIKNHVEDFKLTLKA